MIKTDSSDPTIPSAPRRITLRSWLLSGEIYLILLVAGFLRFYQINRTEFDQDQAIIFRMARDAVVHGLLPATSNTASIGIAHSAGVIYLFMLPALVSSNPLGGAILVGIFSTASVLLTYFFTRRYYGRFAGTAAALLYATAAKPLIYGRFIWQPNLMSPFVVLFLFALFWGVVERRRGWLFPALVLLGVLYQMHEIAILLAVPLLVAVVLALGTLRWRDLALAGASLLIIFFPYLLWEAFTRFKDLHTILVLAKQHAHINGQAIYFYWLFLIPYEHTPTDVHSVVLLLSPMLSWLRVVVPLLTTLAFVALGGQLIALQRQQAAEEKDSGYAAISTSSLWCWWMSLWNTPYKRGLVVLLVWQIVPLLLLSRHSIDLHAQYFLMFMPGPFILIGLFASRVVQWVQRLGGRWRVAGSGMYFLIPIVIAAQFMGSVASVVDSGRGNSNDAFNPYHNDLFSLQHALAEADMLAQQRHLQRLYVTTDDVTQTALRYLGEQTHTPATLFDASRCLVLPDPAKGPAVLLVGPHDALINALVHQFAKASLIATPERAGGSPFRLYILTSIAEQTAPVDTFVHGLQLLKGQTQRLRDGNVSWLVTQWGLMQAEQPQFRMSYGYSMTMHSKGSQTGTSSTCSFTSTRTGDQLLVAFDRKSTSSSSLAVEAKSFTLSPYNPSYLLFHLETDSDRSTSWTPLYTKNGRNHIDLQVGGV